MYHHQSGKAARWAAALCIALFMLCTAMAVAGDKVLTPEDVIKIKVCQAVEISPDGSLIACTVSVPRTLDEPTGGAYSELHLISTKTGERRPFITGKVNVFSPQWSPDGSIIAFLTQRGEGQETQVWLIPVNGGEAYCVTQAETNVFDFRWHPKGDQIAYIATTPKSKREKELDKKGYGFVFYEENLRHRNLYLTDVLADRSKAVAVQLTKDVTVWNFEFSNDGKTIVAGVSEKNLIDHQYMFQKLHLLDIASKKLTRLIDNPGKLGNFAFSPDDKQVVYASALDRKDHAVSQVCVAQVADGSCKNLTPANFRGHVNWVAWKDNATVFYRADEGVWTTWRLANTAGGEHTTLLHSASHNIVFGAPSFTADFAHFAMTGSAPDMPADIFYWGGKDAPKRLTNMNPWLAERVLGRQEVVQYQARDGATIEGILFYPTDYRAGEKYPLVVFVHGGPEAHHSNHWLTGYFQPLQVLCGKGYLSFCPNYRASTGYGVEFAMAGYGDPAGKEFDDIADGIDFLVGRNLADPERVGLSGGSYGGYAAAWFATYYTKYVRATCMFVGVSNVISKRNTTDIPYEELYVHSGQKLELTWDLSLKRSPIYHAHQSRTAVLIVGGSADTRVHPSQSIELYRILKMNDHPAVRLVQYPGEGHGNRNQPGRWDILLRQLDWLDWYVKDKKPFDGPMPPLDISKAYGFKLPE